MRHIYHARGKRSCQETLIPMAIGDELRERECYVVNEHVWGCICGHSKYGSGDIASTHDYALCISLSSHLLCTGGGG